MFGKFYDIPSLPFQDIEKPNVPDRRTLRITKANNSKELAPGPYFSIINIHLVDINVFAKFHEIPSLPFQDNEKPKCRRQTDRQHENSIPPTNSLCVGYNHENWMI